MVYLHVCLLHGSQSALALVDRGCSYINLVNMIMSEFSLDPTKVAVSLKYILNDDLPAIRIKNDSNVLAYILLKEVDRDPAKYPLIIDIIDAAIQYPSDMVTDNAYRNSELYTLQDVATEICEASSGVFLGLTTDFLLLLRSDVSSTLITNFAAFDFSISDVYRDLGEHGGEYYSMLDVAGCGLYSKLPEVRSMNGVDD
ncbi:Hypothetical predicted protein [Olea europaea subsp. europaea]|uniref:Uncharacterized protein n=1 Tax=Olea europaea subsp. europaea TaxID=158383 RepID=A0A8S0R231_OLEEU|nr:Hypothetical predicted protein [Olea europaea subsp. europaea]